MECFYASIDTASLFAKQVLDSLGSLLDTTDTYMSSLLAFNAKPCKSLPAVHPDVSKLLSKVK